MDGRRNLRSQTQRKGRKNRLTGWAWPWSAYQETAVQTKHGFLATGVNQKFIVPRGAGAPGTESLGQRSQAAPDSRDWLGVSKPQARSSRSVTKFVTEPRFVQPDTQQTQSLRHRRLSKKRVYSTGKQEGRCRERASNLLLQESQGYLRPTNSNTVGSCACCLITLWVPIFTWNTMTVGGLYETQIVMCHVLNVQDSICLL